MCLPQDIQPTRSLLCKWKVCADGSVFEAAQSSYANDFPEGFGFESSMALPSLEVEDPYPERPGEPYCLNCRCKFKSKCKLNHPKHQRLERTMDNFYDKQEKCKLGGKCKFNHPKEIEILPLTGKQTIYTSTIDEIPHIDAADSSVPAKTHALAAP
ncbi:hypothetical protein ACP4OV_029434 [Aristida adscensionis]